MADSHLISHQIKILLDDSVFPPNHQQSHRLIKFGTPSVSIGEATWETVIAHHYCVNTIINIAATILTIILLVLYLDHCH